MEEILKQVTGGAALDPAMLAKAQQLWGVMDDLATRDPAAYRAFLAKRKAEHEQALAEAPVTRFTLRTTAKHPSGVEVQVNFIALPKMPAPASLAEAIPMNVFALAGDSSSTLHVFAVVVHPSVFGLIDNAQLRDDLVELGLASLEERQLCRAISRKFKITEAEAEPATTKEKPGVDATAKPAASAAAKPDIQFRAPPPPPTLASSDSERVAAIVIPGLTDSQRSPGTKMVQVLSETCVADADAGVQTPAYTLTVDSSQGAGRGALKLVVDLPLVCAVADICVDVTPRRVELQVERRYALTVDLPQATDPDSPGQRAKWSARHHTLTLTLPVATA